MRLRSFSKIVCLASLLHAVGAPAWAQSTMPSQAYVVDAADKIVGTPFGTDAVLVQTSVGAIAVGAVGGALAPVEYSYETSDCTGQPYLFNTFGNSLVTRGGINPAGTQIIYQQLDQGGTRTIKSFKNTSTSYRCVSFRIGTDEYVSPAKATSAPQFTPPLRIAIMSAPTVPQPYAVDSAGKVVGLMLSDTTVMVTVDDSIATQVAIDRNYFGRSVGFFYADQPYQRCSSQPMVLARSFPPEGTFLDKSYFYYPAPGPTQDLHIYHSRGGRGICGNQDSVQTVAPFRKVATSSLDFNFTPPFSLIFK